MQVIVYPTGAVGCAVVGCATNYSVDEIVAKDLPDGVTHVVVDQALLPQASADTWKIVDGTVVVDRASSLRDLLANADTKQARVLAALKVVHALADGGATLDTMLDQTSITFLNSLGLWVAMSAGISPAPTRSYENLDGTTHEVTPAQLGEFLTATGAAIQSTFDAKKTVRGAIMSDKPSITTTAEIDAFAWPQT